MFLQITDVFDHFDDFIIEYGLFQTSPKILLNSYKSRETNFEWRHFNGTKLNYTGHFPVAGPTEGPLDGDWDYTAFSDNEIMGKIIFLKLTHESAFEELCTGDSLRSFFHTIVKVPCELRNIRSFVFMSRFPAIFRI